MPNLGGFEVVGELTVGVLNQIFAGAWDNNIIPHSVDIPAGTPFGPYQLADGVVDIPRAGLQLAMDVPVNGVRITLACEVQVEIANPPIPSARFFNLTADVVARVPLGVLPGTIHVAALLGGIPRANVTATVTSGDPVGPVTVAAVEEFVHARYADGTIPSTVSQTGISLGALSADAWLDLYDDAAHPTHRITVAQPAAAKVAVRIPFHLKLYNLSLGLSPCGVVGTLVLTSDFIVAAGSVTARLSTAAVTLENYAPAPANDAVGSYDNEGANYTINNAGSGGFLENAVKTQLTARATAIAQTIGDIVVAVPTLAQIETFIADQAHSAIVGRGDVALWTPTPPPDGGVTVTDVKPLALPDAIAFCLNNPGGNTGAIANFIPPARSCAIALDGAKVIALIREQINKPEADGGFGGIPRTFHDINGHDARVTRLDVSLRNGSIHFEGDVTVIDAIADSIDVDASFEAEVGLEWVDEAGGQMLRPFVISQDVDLSLLAWILSFLIGFITFGIVGGIVGIVLTAVVEGIAEKIGGAIIRDDVTGQVKSIGAWPQQLEGIGTVTTRFENPVIIDTQSVMFPDEYLVTATFATVTDALARSNGPYVVPEGAEVTFLGGPNKPNTTYGWDFGDGATSNLRVAKHRYADDGLYVAKLTTTVDEEGGVTTRHFAAVRVSNVAPSVSAGPPITIDEGEEIQYEAAFSDPGWPDTHTAIFDFGDNSSPAHGAVMEEHDPPLGTGTARAKHAYCDNGAYVVTARVMDDDGGIGVSTKHVTVRNVAPTVDAGPDLYAYRCTPITLVARFSDPGWCDTHVGTWSFGDCSEPLPATIRERHEPPAGCGIAAATHRYECCGEFFATITVVDDDGGIGRDHLIVRVVDVENRDFESGFRSIDLGVVANEWTPYERAHAAAAANAHFDAEEFVVHGGQRSQKATSSASGRAGLWQRVGANVGWDYQVTAWFHMREGSRGKYRLGIGPAGETDPSAPAITWSEGADDREWAVLSTRATAAAAAITIFLEAEAPDAGREGVVWFDDVELLPYPCPLGDAPPCVPEQARETCIDWRSETTPRVLGPTFQDRGFTFTAAGQESLRIVVWGPPTGAGKLALPRKALLVSLPFAASKVIARVAAGTRTPIVMRGADPGGQVAGPVATGGQSGIVEPLELRASGITQLELTGGGGEGLLIELCISASDAKEKQHG
jgi:PKD domain-containing protein